MCGPCGLDVESEDSQGLTNYLQQHVLSDQHTDRVAKFRQNSTSMVPAYVLKYRFCCESCSASFTTYNSLSSHNNCPRSRFRQVGYWLCLYPIANHFCLGVFHVILTQHPQSLPSICEQQLTPELWPHVPLCQVVVRVPLSPQSTMCLIQRMTLLRWWTLPILPPVLILRIPRRGLKFKRSRASDLQSQRHLDSLYSPQASL